MFNERLREAMTARSMSAAALSEACNEAFSQRTIWRWRAGTAVPGAEALPLLCRALEVTADWLIGAGDDGGPSTPTTKEPTP